MTKRVLVIDDAEGIRDAFLISLEQSGAQIETASTGEEGIEKALINKPDLVFLDLKMPGMSGVETMRKLLHNCPGINIYIMTAFYQEFMKELEKAREDGLLFELCCKPMGGDQIQLIVNSLLKD